MMECPHNPNIRSGACKKCSPHCGFVPNEIARRKLAIANGDGLTPNTIGLRRLKIRKRRD